MIAGMGKIVEKQYIQVTITSDFSLLLDSRYIPQNQKDNLEITYL